MDASVDLAPVTHAGAAGLLSYRVAVRLAQRLGFCLFALQAGKAPADGAMTEAVDVLLLE